MLKKTLIMIVLFGLLIPLTPGLYVNENVVSADNLNSIVRLEASNVVSHYIRHASDRGKISAGVSPLEDSEWIIVAGLADPNAISIQSVNQPGYYLRHRNGEVWLDAFADTALYQADATWWKRPGLADSHMVSFESYNFPGEYLRHRDYLLYKEAVSTNLAKEDATFREMPMLVAPSLNVALNAAVTASGQCNANEIPAYAVDGSSSTKWCDNSSSPTGVRWLQLDLKHTYNIDRWVLENACVGEAGYCPNRNTAAFKIQKSTDGITWIDVDVVTNNYSSIVERYVPAFTTRYVRLYITNPSHQDAIARIYSLELYEAREVTPDMESPYRNLAREAAVRASGECTALGLEAPQFAVDGRTDTKWCDNSNIQNRWLELDLGYTYNINQWVVKNACIGEPGQCPFRNTNTFKLQKSADGTVWVDVDSVMDNSTTIVKRYVPAFTSRYVRLYVTKSGIQDNNARLYELELYGTDTYEVPSVPQVNQAPVDYVNPFMNTLGDNGQANPGATTPFGLVKLGPDSDGGAFSGYYYENQSIEGFSHLRIDGVGCSGAGGNILMKPGIGAFTKDRNVYKEKYDKSSETASAGYYKVGLASGIQAELTVSPRVGMHRYTFPQSNDANVIIDLGHSYASMLDASLVVENGNEISGMVKAQNVCNHGNYTLYFSIKFDKNFESFKSWQGSAVNDVVASRSGSDIGVWAKFNTQANEVIQAKVGLSPISVAQAKIERDNEIVGWDFDNQRNQTRNTWSQLLDKMEVVGGDEEYKSIFYTMLYRSFLMPSNVTSSAGTYRAARDEGTVRNTSTTAADYDYYSGWTTWDDFRKFSLISLLEPQKYKNIARSLVDMYKTRGSYVQWGDGYWPSPTVRNEFAGAVLLDAYVKGLGDYDTAAALTGMALDTDNYSTNQSEVSGKLEKAYSAYFPMKLAYLLGDTMKYNQYRNIALSYSTLWNPAQLDNEGNARGFFTPNAQAVTDVQQVNQYAYQGNLWTYRWFVPHDINGLAALHGSKQKMADDLQYFFDINEYVAVNEPDLHAPYLFNYLGKPYLTQYYARQFTTEAVTQKYHNHGLYAYPIKSRVYRNDPEGYLPSMDDDAGAMSSWFVYSAMGLFPANPGDPYYLIGSPIFPEIKLHVDGGNTFTVKANNVSSANRYIQSATLNGVSFNNTWIDYTTIMAGGTLEFIMGASPNLNWGADPTSAPPVFAGW